MKSHQCRIRNTLPSSTFQANVGMKIIRAPSHFNAFMLFLKPLTIQRLYSPYYISRKMITQKEKYLYMTTGSGDVVDTKFNLIRHQRLPVSGDW